MNAAPLMEKARILKKRLTAAWGRSLHPETGMICLRPFYYMNISGNGLVYPCCPGLVNMPLGTVSYKRTFESIWNGPAARIFRKTMLSTRLDGVCVRKSCPFFLNGLLPRQTGKGLDMTRTAPGLFPDGLMDDGAVMSAIRSAASTLDYTPRFIGLACDRRCNLSCASCRSINVTRLSKEESAYLDKVTEYLHEAGPNLLELEALGSGEVFYSPFTLSLLRSMDRKDFPRLKTHIVTNGQLFTQAMWESLGPGRGFINRVDVSVDAATKSTYEAIRIGGSWERLTKNLEFISSLRISKEIGFFALNFVISARNFTEIPLFLDMAKNLGADQVVMTLLHNWGKAMRYEFEKEAVHFPQHPLHGEFLKTLQKAREQSPNVLLGFSVKKDK